MMSEKLDGVRCFYNGNSGKLYSRNGLNFKPPQSWLKALSNIKMSLDGELWTMRDDFNRCSGICRNQSPAEDSWNEVKFMVFDAPCEVGGNFESRIK